MKKVKLSLWGGFHNVGEIHVMVSERDYELLKNKEIDMAEALSPYQNSRVGRHFCGISDWECGGIYRNLHWKKI